MASAADYADWIVANADKKGTPEFDTVARAYQQAKQKVAAPEMNLDPTVGMSGFDKFAAGAGKAIVDTGRGLRQLGSYVGIGNQDAIQNDINQAKTMDAPLMNTGAGLAGNVTGQIGMALAPAGALARTGGLAAKAGQAWLMPQTLAGAAGAGAAQGFVQPTATGESRAFNTGIGAAGGAIAPAIGTLYKTGKALVQPFTQGGQEQIAGRALQRFATDPASIDAAAGAAQLVPGSMPTLAEATGDIGLAQLQRSLRNNPDANQAITQRMMANQEARSTALQDIAGNPADRASWVKARGDVATENYGAAMASTPEMTPWIKGQITQLQQRPSFQKAWPKAVEMAQEDGLKLDPSNVVQVAHYTKLALDDAIGGAKAGGLAGEAHAITGTRDKLVSLMESKDFAPAYREARQTYADMSKPINQMDVGQFLQNKLQPALSDFGATVRTTPQQYAQALRNGDQTARQATGFAGAKLENILSPEHFAMVNNIGKDLGRSAQAQELGMAKGSPTAQNLLGHDVLQEALKGTGIPRGLIQSGLAETFLARPASIVAKPMEQKIMGLLGNAALDPKEAKRLLDLARKRGLFAGLESAAPYAVQPGVGGSMGLLNLLQQ